MAALGKAGDSRQVMPNALKRLIDSPELRRRLGAWGREIVERELTQEKLIQETLALYEEVLR